MVFLCGLGFGPDGEVPAGRGFYPHGIWGEYFDDLDAAGRLGQPPPSSPFTRFVFRRLDPAIDFVWSEVRSPAPNLGPEYWSARFTGRLRVPETADYVFSLEQLDDAGRLYIDGELVLDAWRIQAPWVHYSRPVHLQEGIHEVVVEYHQGPGPEGAIRLCWFSPTRPKELVSFLDGVQAEYFEDPNADNYTIGQPPPGPCFTERVLTRREEVIDFHWGPTPHPDIDAIYWSVRWQGSLLVPKSERYTFYLENLDDAGRLYVDGRRVINAWRLQQVERVSSRPIFLEAGLHDICVEFQQGEPPAASIRLCWSSPSLPKEVIPPAGRPGAGG